MWQCGPLHHSLPGSLYRLNSTFDTKALFISMMMARANGAISDEVSGAELTDQFSVTRGAVRRVPRQ